jgi:hypothetical protein
MMPKKGIGKSYHLSADLPMPVGNIIHHTINESVGKLFENLAHEDAKTRQHMERIAKYVPKGVVSCQRGGDWGLANGCVFFKMDGYEGVNYPMTFGPSFIDDDASGNEIEIFKKLVQTSRRGILCLGMGLGKAWSRSLCKLII